MDTLVHAIILSTQFGQPPKMDKHLLDEPDLLTRAMAAGERLGIRWEQLAQAGNDDTDIVLRAELKRRLRVDTLGVLQHQLQRFHGNALLITDHVTPTLADALRERDIAFIDTAGNAYLATPQFLVWVKGQRAPLMHDTADTTGRAFTATGLQVLFVLLCHPEWIDHPYRTIAQHAGVAHGTVGWVMAELPTLGFAAKINGKRRLIHGERLLRQWVEAYARALRPKLVLGRYRAQTLTWVNTDLFQHYGVALGGEPAGACLTGYLQPGTATFYTAKRTYAPMVVDQALRTDPNGNVEFLRQFWRFEHQPADQPAGLVPDILIYADLLALGDARCLETAELLHERIVDRFK
jgi:hypothetical protein